ncbi:hypothetical protein PVAG01_07927 [Phlyctema vagabunda]|uniref:Uncharacterized protein n=1 Tax=Phlyctema vagabunda TaxID=108571 RepID=A0ABR4PDT7_9HELO
MEAVVMEQVSDPPPHAQPHATQQAPASPTSPSPQPEERQSRSQSSDALTDGSLQSIDVESVLSVRNTPERTTDDSAANTPLQDLGPDSVETLSEAAERPLLLGEDEDIDETSAIRVEGAITPTSKRKRPSINYNLDDLKYNSFARASPATGERSIKRVKKRPEIRGVIIGVWRDSSIARDEDKHVIFGFIDVHDRLRTRIYPMNRHGEECIANIPTGAGGCWVTFPRIIFEEHLAQLGQAEIKEYVKLRMDNLGELDPEVSRLNDMKAAKDAVDTVARQDASPQGRPTGPPRGPRKSGNRESVPQPSPANTPSFKAVNAASTPTQQPQTDIKPTNGVLLGHWEGSDGETEADKHAVFGVIGANDCFRVKVARQTRDGRFRDGNFPVGAGALWLYYKEVVLEPELAGLSRAAVKEYVRIRQQESVLDQNPQVKKANERSAIERAQIAAAAMASNDPDEPVVRRAEPEVELRHSARAESRMALRQQAEAETNAAEKIRKQKAEAREKQNEKTRKEVAVAEAAIKGAAQQQLNNNIRKLNRVWETQQAVMSTGPRVPVSSEEIKFFQGIKYERRETGPFQGKLTSVGQLINIDGEDYVEYRVLTKPSFC